MKNTQFTLMALICLIFIEACYIAPSKTAPNNDGTCSENSQMYFLEMAKTADTTKLHKELQESMSYFEDKPMFDTTKFMRSCLGVKENYTSNTLGFSIENSTADMFQYLLTATKYKVDNSIMGYNSTKNSMNLLMEKAIDIFKNKKTYEAARIIKILQENGASLNLEKIIESGDLETITALHENSVNLQAECAPNSIVPNLAIGTCIDMAKSLSNKIYQYLSEQGYKTVEQQKIIAQQEKQEQETALLRERQEQTNDKIKEKIKKVEELLIANKLEDGINECGIAPSNSDVDMQKGHIIIALDMPEIRLSDDSLKGKYYDLCKKQLVDKVRKLPKNKINTPRLASVYYDQYYQIVGDVIQNDGKMILVTATPLHNTVMVQISGPIIGKCALTPNKYIPFNGCVKYLGEKTYPTLLGKQTVPNYQLLFCGSED
jgi:hypothetical protein